MELIGEYDEIEIPPVKCLCPAFRSGFRYPFRLFVCLSLALRLCGAFSPTGCPPQLRGRR